VLGPSQAATVKVQAPGGSPVAGARVSVSALACEQIFTDISEEYARDIALQFGTQVRATPAGFAIGRTMISVPSELGRLLTATTDVQGTAVIKGVTLDESAGLQVVSDAFGAQFSSVYLHQFKGSIADLQKTVTLLPVGRVSGRVHTGDGAAARGVSVTVSSREAQSSNQAANIFRNGQAVVTTDETGRFEVPALAAGSLEILVTMPRNSTLRARVPAGRSMQVKPGAVTQLDIPVEPAVRVKGVVRERGTGKPIAGLTVLLGDGDGNYMEEVETDAQGRYSWLATPGPVYRIPGIPPSFLDLTREERRQSAVPVIVRGAEFELPPLELTRAATVRGTVRDDQGQPVAGASVRAQWMAHDLQFGHVRLHDTSAMSNERGEFAVEGVDPQAELRLTARFKDLVFEKPVVLRGDKARAVDLRIGSSYGLAISGRVLDTAGKPVAGAEVALWLRPWMPPPNVGTPEPVTFDGQRFLRTDAAGRFQAPRRLPPDGEYRAVVRAEGISTGQTAWLAVSRTTATAFPDLVVHRLRSLEGQVHDRQNRPVVGALVERTTDAPASLRTATDPGGRFRLLDPVDAPGFLFIEKSGFRFHGQPLDLAGKEVGLILTRTDEPADSAMRTLPPPRPHEECQALARRLLQPYVKAVLTKSDKTDRLGALKLLAKLDPAAVLEQLEKKPSKDPWYDDYLRRAVAQRLLADSPDESLTVINAMRDAGFRATGLLDVYDALPAQERGRKQELLGQALVQTRTVQDASHRLYHLGQIARRFFDLADTVQAVKLLREGQTLARALPTAAFAGYARGAFAEQLALIDVEGALELTKDLRDELEYDRHHGNMAHVLANKKPAEAERILAMMRRPTSPILRDQWAPRICYRMAPVDLGRAQRIAEKIGNPYDMALAYGVMAQALAKGQPAQATQLLYRAFDVLKAHVASKKDHFNSFYCASSIAGCLLPVAEQIDPRLVPECFWQALALRMPCPEDENEAAQRDLSDVPLVLMLARYDRALAGTLLKLVWKRAGAQVRAGSSRAFYTAAALIDPSWAVELVESLPNNPLKDQARTSVVKTLLLRDEERWQEAQKEIGVWVVDVEDM
jgi:protocatechuate 3,4-dioxygenase beta subunit